MHLLLTHHTRLLILAIELLVLLLHLWLLHLLLLSPGTLHLSHLPHLTHLTHLAHHRLLLLYRRLFCNETLCSLNHTNNSQGAIPCFMVTCFELHVRVIYVRQSLQLLLGKLHI